MAKNYTKQSSFADKSPEEMIGIFDNEVCFNTLTSKVYADYLSKGNYNKKVNDEELVFYYFEASFYRNKTIRQLMNMNYKLKNVFSNDINEIIGQKKISIARLENILETIDYITLVLNLKKKCIDKNKNKELIFKENSEYYGQYVLFRDSIKETFNV